MGQEFEIRPLTQSQAERMEQRLCRVRNRVRRFGLRGEIRISDPKDMVGRVISAALDAVPEFGAPRPTNKALAKAVRVSEPTFSRFISGDAGGTTPWFHRGADLLRLIVIGNVSAPSAELAHVADRIVDYFFRDPSDGDGVPRFFSGLRVHSPDPWSRTELGSEILWLARQARLGNGTNGHPARLVFCSGWTPFIQGDLAGRVIADATADAMASGVETTFYYMRGTAAEHSVEDFVRRRPTLDKQVHRVGVDAASPQHWAEYLARTVQFMYFDVPTSNGREASLYLLRAGIFDEPKATEDQALAITCNSAEAGQFRQWVDGVMSAQPR